MENDWLRASRVIQFWHEMPFLNSQFYTFHSPLDKAHFGAPYPVYRMIFMADKKRLL